MNLDFVKNLEMDKIKRIKEGFEWSYSNYEYIKRRYFGKHVVMKYQKVIDCDKSLDVLVERLQIRDYRDFILEFAHPYPYHIDRIEP